MYPGWCNLGTQGGVSRYAMVYQCTRPRLPGPGHSPPKTLLSPATPLIRPGEDHQSGQEKTRARTGIQDQSQDRDPRPEPEPGQGSKTRAKARVRTPEPESGLRTPEPESGLRTPETRRPGSETRRPGSETRRPGSETSNPGIPDTEIWKSWNPALTCHFFDARSQIPFKGS